MSQDIETVVVGGGQAGLATSYHLGLQGREHVVLEQAAQPGEAWRNGRWDSFTLVTPNWSFLLPGAEYKGDAPGNFMPRDEVVARLERYVTDYRMPVRFGTRVTSVVPDPGGEGYSVTTDGSTLHARNVVIATGLFQRPKVSAAAAGLPGSVMQLHSGLYRSPESLPDGAVLVVGSAQSGCQIAQELYQSGRRVYLCVGGAGRVPRRYRGKDIFEWFSLSGSLDRTVDDLPSPRARFAANPHVSGKDGGQNLNLHQFARDGVVLLGHLLGADGDTLRFAPDMKDGLAKADAFEADAVRRIDDFIDRVGLDVPTETLPVLRDGFGLEDITDLSLAASDIATVIWAMGYDFDFSLVKAPILDEYGYPIQKDGVTAVPGLYFVGMPWLHKWKSGLLVGVGEHAELIASEIVARA